MEVYLHPNGKHELWSWPSYSVVGRGQWLWPNFSAAEMRCRKTGAVVISPKFMDRLQLLRDAVKIPLPVNSGYRSPVHNSEVSHTESLDGPHPDAQAVDLKVSHSDAFEVLKLALHLGFIGVGPKQHGESRYLHIDCWWKRSKPAVWTYYEP